MTQKADRWHQTITVGCKSRRIAREASALVESLFSHHGVGVTSGYFEYSDLTTVSRLIAVCFVTIATEY